MRPSWSRWTICVSCTWGRARLLQSSMIDYSIPSYIYIYTYIYIYMCILIYIYIYICIYTHTERHNTIILII